MSKSTSNVSSFELQRARAKHAACNAQLMALGRMRGTLEANNLKKERLYWKDRIVELERKQSH